MASRDRPLRLYKVNISRFVNGQPPAEHEMMRFFQVTPPTVRRMVVALEHLGLISRQLGRPRTITVLVHENDLPRLKPGFGQTVKTTPTGC